MAINSDQPSCSLEDNITGLDFFSASQWLKREGLSLGAVKFEESNKRRLTVIAAKLDQEKSSIELTLAGKNPISYLPSIYHNNVSLEQFLWVIQHIIYKQVAILDNLSDYFTPMNSPMEFCNWVGSWFGTEENSFDTEKSLRMITQFSPELFRWRGTSRGLKAILYILTGVWPVIIENAMPYDAYVLEKSGDNARILEDFSTGTYCTVHFPVQASYFSSAIKMQVARIVQQEKPVHIDCFITYLDNDDNYRKCSVITDSTVMNNGDGILM